MLRVRERPERPSNVRAYHGHAHRAPIGLPHLRRMAEDDCKRSPTDACTRGSCARYVFLVYQLGFVHGLFTNHPQWTPD